MTAQEQKDEPLSTVMVEVLLTLSEGPLHGYGIKRAMEERIGLGFVLGSGSLYQALQRLERRGLVAEAAGSQESGDQRRGRVYRIRPAGRRALARELARMKRVLSHAKRARVAVDPEGAR